MEAVIGLATTFDIKADVLVSLYQSSGHGRRIVALKGKQQIVLLFKAKEPCGKMNELRGLVVNFPEILRLEFHSAPSIRHIWLVWALQKKRRESLNTSIISYPVISL